MHFQRPSIAKLLGLYDRKRFCVIVQTPGYLPGAMMFLGGSGAGVRECGAAPGVLLTWSFVR